MNERAALLAAVGLSAASALAGAACPDSTPYRFLRFEENYAYLRDAACRTDPWDAIKFIPLDGDGERFLTLGGDARLKLINGRDIVIGEDQGDSRNVAAQRFHVHASLRAASAMRFFVEVKANAVSGREPAPLPTDVDKIDTHQAFVDLGSGAAILRLGRQELLFGAGRRIFPRNGSNVRGSFDAARLTLNAGEWRGDAFVFHPVEIDKGAFDDAPVRAQRIGGIYMTKTFAAARPMTLDLYWIQSERDRVRFGSTTGDERRESFGARLAGRNAPWDLDVEGAVQTGRFAGAAVRAWAITGDAGYTFPGPHRPRLTLRLSAASGDKDPADPALQTFHSLFPLGNILDDYFNISVANVLFARPGLEMDLSSSLRARVDAGWTRRMSDRDAIYGPGGAVLRTSGASRAREVGHDIGGRLVWAVQRHLSIDLSGGYYYAGEFLKETAPTRNMWIAFAYISYRF